MSELAARLEALVGPEGLSRLTLPDGEELPCAAPAELEPLRELVRLAAREGLVLLPVGTGSKLARCHKAEHVDFALSTRRYAGVVRYEPEDGTVGARAGTPVAELAAAVREGGHHLTPELPARGPGATLGGVVAAGESGFDRLRYGPLRNHVLGARAVLAKGEETRSGGQLVKNVTGYDLHRLYCGSHGSLCVLTEVALRLFPRPDAREVWTAAFGARGAALDAARAVLELPARPVAVVVHELARAEGAAWTLAVSLAGRPEALAFEGELVGAAVPGAERARGGEAEAAHAHLRDELAGGGASGAGPTLRLTCRRSKLAEALDALERAAAGAELGCRVLAHPGVASASAWLTDDGPGGGPDAGRAAALARALEGAPARLQWLRAPRGLAAEVDLFGPPSPALGWMRRLRDALDPDGVFPRGRCHGRL